MQAKAKSNILHHSGGCNEIIEYKNMSFVKIYFYLCVPNVYANNFPLKFDWKNFTAE